MLQCRNCDDSESGLMANPSYVCPFTNRQQIDILEQRYLQRDAKRSYPDALAFAAGAFIRSRSDLRGNLQKIFRWKLETFLRRKWLWVIAFPANISDCQITTVIDTALLAIDGEVNAVVKAIRMFDDLPYVGIPVTSAFLMALDPSRFTVIDRQAYKALSVEFQLT